MHSMWYLWPGRAAKISQNPCPFCVFHRCPPAAPPPHSCHLQKLRYRRAASGDLAVLSEVACSRCSSARTLLEDVNGGVASNGLQQIVYAKIVRHRFAVVFVCKAPFNGAIQAVDNGPTGFCR